MPIDSIPARLRARGATNPAQAAFWTREPRGWVPTPFGAYAANVRRVAAALVDVGMQVGEHIAILGPNCPQWVMAHVGAMTAGGVPAGIYRTACEDGVRHVLAHSRSRVLVVQDAGTFRRVAQWAPQATAALRRVVLMEGEVARGSDDPRVLTWAQFVSGCSADALLEADRRLGAVGPHDPAALIYTSGTTGPPRAAALSHTNVCFSADAAGSLFDLGGADTTLSYLPLSHVAEQMFTIYGPITGGSSTYFVHSMDQLARDLREVRPTVFFGVPLVWDRMRREALRAVAELSPAKRRLGRWATSVGNRNSHRRCRSALPGRLEEMQFALALPITHISYWTSRDEPDTLEPWPGRARS